MKIVVTSWPALGASGTMLMTRFLAVSDDEPQLRKEPRGDGAEAPLEGAGSVEFRRGRRSKMRFQSIAAADADAAAWRAGGGGGALWFSAGARAGSSGEARGAARGAARRGGAWLAEGGNDGLVRGARESVAHEGENHGAEHSCWCGPARRRRRFVVSTLRSVPRFSALFCN